MAAAARWSGATRFVCTWHMCTFNGCAGENLVLVGGFAGRDCCALVARGGRCRIMAALGL